MEANTIPLDQEISEADEPTTLWLHTGERRKSIDSSGLDVKPIVVEGEGVRISPRLMSLGEPYLFWFAGAYLLAVKRGDKEVDIYRIPPL